MTKFTLFYTASVVVEAENLDEARKQTPQIDVQRSKILYADEEMLDFAAHLDSLESFHQGSILNGFMYQGATKEMNLVYNTRETVVKGHDFIGHGNKRIGVPWRQDNTWLDFLKLIVAYKRAEADAENNDELRKGCDMLETYIRDKPLRKNGELWSKPYYDKDEDDD